MDVSLLMDRLTPEDVIALFESKSRELNEDLFVEIFAKRPKLAIAATKRLNGSLEDVTVLHNFVDDSHNLRFRIKINLLLKFVQSLSHFRGQLADAVNITDELIRLGVDFAIRTKYSEFSKLFAHNIAIKLCSMDARIDWQLTYMWFLCQKPAFKGLVFRELPDYWTGRAVPRLKRIDRSSDVRPDVCRKFVVMLLIGGHFERFQQLLKPEDLEELDDRSRKLLLYFGFDFIECLNSTRIKSIHNNNNDVLIDCKHSYSEVLAKYPKLDQFLSDCQYFHKPLPLKHQIRVFLRRREASNLNEYAKQLYKNAIIPKPLSQFLRFKEFIEF